MKSEEEVPFALMWAEEREKIDVAGATVTGPDFPSSVESYYT